MDNGIKSLFECFVKQHVEAAFQTDEQSLWMKPLFNSNVLSPDRPSLPQGPTLERVAF